MWMKNIRLASMVGAALTAMAANAQAHQVWVTTEAVDGKLVAVVKYGDVAKRAAPDLKKLVSLSVRGPAGETNLRWTLKEDKRDGHPVLVSAPFAATAGAMLVAAYDNGYWTTPAKDNPDGREVNASKLLVPDSKGSLWVPKFAKTLLSPGAFKQVLGTELEIVPLKDPLALAAGDALPVKLLFQGKPAAGVKIAYGDGVTEIDEDKLPTVTTGADGQALIPLARKGAYLLIAEHAGKPLQPALSAEDEPYASLAFDLP